MVRLFAQPLFCAIESIPVRCLFSFNEHNAALIRVEEECLYTHCSELISLGTVLKSYLF